MHTFLPALKVINDRLSISNAKWCFGGSTSLLIHGVKVQPNDIDIAVNTEDFEIVYSCVKDLGFKIDADTGKAKGVINGVDVEIIPFDISTETIIKVDFEGGDFPVYELDRELFFYKGRPGKEEKIMLIEERIKELVNK